MDFEDYIPDALEMVSAWKIEPEDIPQAVNDQVWAPSLIMIVNFGLRLLD